MVRNLLAAVLVGAWALAVLAVLLYGPVRGPGCVTMAIDGETACRSVERHPDR
jgi:hypothetical protein